MSGYVPRRRILPPGTAPSSPKEAAERREREILDRPDTGRADPEKIAVLERVLGIG